MTKNKTYQKISNIIFTSKNFYSILYMIVFWCLTIESGYAQRKEIDSLLNLVYTIEETDGFQTDTNYLNLINKLSNRYYTLYPDSAMYWADTSLVLCKEINYEKGIVDALRNKGIVFRTDYNYIKALDLYLEALRIAEKISYTEGIGSIYNGIAIVYKEQKMYGKALEYYEKSLQINRETNDERGIAIGLNNIAIVYFGNKEFDKALNKHLESLEIRKKTGDKKGISNSLNNIGDVYAGLKKYEQAIQYYSEAESINREIVNNRGLSSDLKSLADVYLKLNQTSKSIQYARLSLDVSLKVGYLEKVKDCYEIISKIYQAENRYDSALYNYQLFKLYSDSLKNSQDSKKTERLFVEYEFETEQAKRDAINKSKLNEQRLISLALIIAFIGVLVFAYSIYTSRKKISLANKNLTVANEEILIKNEEISSQKEELIQTLAVVNSHQEIIEEQNLTKNKLFAIIGHDLRAPVNSLKSLMSMVTDFDMSAEEFREISEKLKNGVEYVHFTLNNLLLWANNQMYGIQTKPVRVSLYEIAKENYNLFGEIANDKQLHLNNEIDQDLTVWADRDQVNLIFRNLISNAIKFTNTGGVVRILAKNSGEHCQITIADTGVGMSPEILGNLFSHTLLVHTFGTDNEKGTGLGLILCKDFVEKNGGKIWVESEEGRGTNFHFTLPLSENQVDSKP